MDITVDLTRELASAVTNILAESETKPVSLKATYVYEYTEDEFCLVPRIEIEWYR